MKFSAWDVLLPLLLAIPAWAQEQTPAAPAGPPAPPSLPVMPVLENNGKPMVLPFHCTDDDIQWAGLTCSEDDPCPIYLELASMAAQGGKIVTAGNIHSAAVTLYTAVLVSEDAGRTWTEAHERIRGAGLDHIQFLDGETAWVSGLTLYPLPQDPFLLLTTDAGKTWRQRPIAGENHPGAIQQFFFSSRADGFLLIDRGPAETRDRYERFESADGGESWTIQEESTKPLKLRQTVVPSTDWRLRVDSSTQSYHLERRQGQRWIGVAAFAVKIGACKPEAGGGGLNPPR
ncbi:MAG: WD40/YVTN/BNR-like repeat-containing protein [Bryobacteraceae bacterium]